MLGFILLVCCLFAGPNNRHKEDEYREGEYVTAWLSKEKARQIMRYHGAPGIKITSDRVYIKRDGKWICVYRDPSSLPESNVRPAISTAGTHVARESSWWSLRPFFRSSGG